MAILSQAHRLLFVMTPRTGCTAIGRLLEDSLGGIACWTTSSTNAAISSFSASTYAATAARARHSDRRAAPLVVCLRCRPEPIRLAGVALSKLATGYQPSLQDPNSWVHKVKGYAERMEYCRTHTFTEWLEQRYARSVWDRLKGAGKKTLNAPYLDGVDFVMRFENLQHDFGEALRQAGVTQTLTIPSINITANRDKDYRRYHTPSTRRLVEYALDRELVQLGYEY